MKMRKEQKIKSQDRHGKVQELKEENDNQFNIRKKKLIKKINNIGNRCQLVETQKQNKIDAYINKEIYRKIRVQENNEQIKKDEYDSRSNILEYQREMVGRGLMKDNLIALKRNQSMYC